MANSVQILAKIARNAQQMGLVVASQSATEVVIGTMTISYEKASIQGPMGGVDGNVSPFLGIGVATPGKIKVVSTDAIENDAVMMKVLAICTRFANNVVIDDGVATVEVAGHPDLVMMGE